MRILNLSYSFQNAELKLPKNAKTHIEYGTIGAYGLMIKELSFQVLFEGLDITSIYC